MTSTGNLKPVKCKLHIASSLMYHTLVMLALKCFIRTLLIAFKSPNTLFAACLLFSVFNTSQVTCFCYEPCKF